MYRRDIAHLPKAIDRVAWVNLIFELGRFHSHNYETTINAVLIGEHFMQYEEPRTPYTYLKNTSPILKTIVPQTYSVELAHVVTVIAAKFNEDSGYVSTLSAANNTNNYYVYKMEWEICILLNFCVWHDNIISYLSISSNMNLGSWLWDLGKAICLNRELLKSRFETILCAIVILGRKNKLAPLIKYKERIFYMLLESIADQNDIEISDVIRKYNIFSTNKI